MAKDPELYKSVLAMVEAYKAKGGKVTVIPGGQRTDPDQIKTAWGYGNKGKKKAPTPEVDKE
jgi:hypothetical protein